MTTIERYLRILIFSPVILAALLIGAIGIVIAYIMLGFLTLASKFPGKGPTVVEERRRSPDRWEPIDEHEIY